MKRLINWKIFSILLSLSLISVACVIPYVITVQGELLRKIGQPLWVIFTIQFIQCFVLFSIAIFSGLIFTKRVYFHIPLFETITGGGDHKKIFKSIFLTSFFWGIVTAGTIYSLDILFTSLGVKVSVHDVLAPVWQTLLASFYGGITEEIVMRLFLMTLFIWIIMKLFRQKKPSNASIIVAMAFAAIIFGLGHLPITASLTKITPLVVIRAVVLNGVGGIIFGFLFWKKGLEAAMLAHFTADIFLLTVLPALSSL